MISEIDVLRSSIPFWDVVIAVTAVVLLFGAVGPIIIEFTNLVVSSTWKTRIRVVSAVLLIAGTGGQIGAQLRIAAISNRIVGILDENGKGLEREVERLKAVNLAHAETIINLVAGQGRQDIKVDTAVTTASSAATTASSAETKAKTAETRTRPRELDSDDVFMNVSGKKYRGSRVVTVVRLAEPEPYKYANNLLRGLERANFKITVESLKVPSPHVGTLICEGPGANALSRALSNGSAYNKVLHSKDKEWSDICSPSLSGARADLLREVLTGNIFVPTEIPRSGIVIFVGHNPQVVR